MARHSSRPRGYRAIQDNGRKIHTADQLKQAHLEAMVEDDMIEEIRSAAGPGGWLFYHTRDSRGSPAGFLDVVLLRGSQLWIVELKRERESRGLTEDQEKWLEALRNVTEVRTAVIRPRDLERLTDAMTAATT